MSVLAEHSTLTIPGDPTPLFIATPQDAAKEYAVLWLQGWRSTIEKHHETLTRLAAQTGIPFAMVDYAGHGTHPVPLEQTTRKQQFDEAVAAFDYLKGAGYERIIVAGTSFGGYLAALLSKERSPYALILRAAAIYKDEEFSLSYDKRQGVANDTYEKFKHTVSPSSDLTALKAVAGFTGSTYVIEHEVDSVIPRNILRAYFAVAKRGNYLVVPNTDHAVALTPEPEKHYRYIEQAVVAATDLIRAESPLQ